MSSRRASSCLPPRSHFRVSPSIPFPAYNSSLPLPLQSVFSVVTIFPLFCHCPSGRCMCLKRVSIPSFSSFLATSRRCASAIIRQTILGHSVDLPHGRSSGPLPTSDQITFCIRSRMSTSISHRNSYQIYILLKI